MNHELPDILEDCLSRLQQGGTMEQCLERYPGVATELRPLLETAQMLLALERVTVTQRARAAQKMRLQALILDRKLEKRKARPWFLPAPALRPLAIVVATLLLLVTGGILVGWTSQDSLPGQPLYSVKRMTEGLRLAVASPESKIELHTRLADRRMHEMVLLAARGDMKYLEPLTQQVRRNMNIATSLAQFHQGSRLELRRRVEESYQQRSEQLRALLLSAPEPSKAAIQRALLITDARYRQTIQELND